jgi:predicted protein tyrosine phosphatase
VAEDGIKSGCDEALKHRIPITYYARCNSSQLQNAEDHMKIREVVVCLDLSSNYQFSQFIMLHELRNYII